MAARSALRVVLSNRAGLASLTRNRPRGEAGTAGLSCRLISIGILPVDVRPLALRVCSTYLRTLAECEFIACLVKLLVLVLGLPQVAFSSGWR